MCTFKYIYCQVWAGSVNISDIRLLSRLSLLAPAAKVNQKEKEQQQTTSDPKASSCPPTSLTAEELEKEQEKVRPSDTGAAESYHLL